MPIQKCCVRCFFRVLINQFFTISPITIPGSVMYVNITHLYNDTDLVLTTTVKVPFIMINTLIVILGLFGNGIVLFASIKYNAVEMDKVSLLFLENLALADSILTIARYLPKLITLCSNRWILGETMCFINVFSATSYMGVRLSLLQQFRVTDGLF